MSETSFKILIVDDEPEILESLSMIFKSQGFEPMTAATGAEAIDVFSSELTPVIVCDNSLPDAQGLDLLREFKTILPEVQVLMVTGKGTIDIAVAAMKAGMFDFITKPVDPEHLVQLVIRAHQLYTALEDKRSLMEQVSMFNDSPLVGKAPSFKGLIRLVNTVAPTDSTVLIEGESGTGKELVARMVHSRSRRAKGPFIAVDCGAIPEGLVESELFGHEKGAFTGASYTKQGKFERANNGTLFLDEITNLPLASQSKLLRALQEMVIERVGGTRQIPINIRLVAATNVPLNEAVSEKRFREDLFYRLNIVRITIPPLRERKQDILPLCMHFIDKHREKVNSPVTGISKEALRVLMQHSWPGNIRELENTIEHALIMSKSPEILPYDLPELGSDRAQISKLGEAEKDLIIKALKDTGGNKYQAARILGIPRSSLYSKIKKLGIP